MITAKSKYCDPRCLGTWKPICATNDGKSFKIFTSYCGMERINCELENGIYPIHCVK